MMKVAVALMVSVSMVAGVAAQMPSVSTKKLGVDVVSLRSGQKLFGAVLSRDAQGTTFICEREWLSRTYKGYYARHLELEREQSEQARKQLAARIGTWIEQRADQPAFVAHLKDEQRRLLGDQEVAADAPPDLSQFVSIDLKAKHVRGLFMQPADRKQAVLLAWREKLKNVTTRSSESLQKELSKLNVEIEESADELLGRLPSAPQTDRQWAAKVAVVEYELLQSLDLQGTGDFIARSNDEQRPPLAELFSSMMQEQVRQLIDVGGGLGQKGLDGNARNEDEKVWLRKAIKLAETEGVNGFRVTRQVLDAQQQAVSVTSQFYAKLPEGDWQEIWSNTARGSVAEVDAESRKQLGETEAIEKVVQGLNAAGLGVADDKLQEALGFGAATMGALDSTNAAFAAFVRTASRHLDIPIAVPPATSK